MSHWIHTQRRIVKTAAQNFVRNAWLSIAAMAVMVITLSIVLFSVVARATFDHTIEEVSDKITVSLYLKDEVTAQQRDQLIDELKQLPNVERVTYLDKDDVREEFRADPKNAELSEALALAEDNPFPATVRVKPADPDRIIEIQQFVERPEVKALQSDPTSYSGDRKQAIDNITRSTGLMQRLGIVGIIVFSVVCMMIIFNTIQMAIFNRRDELTIMRLLGASTWFIRGPFIFEMVFAGIAAALVALGLCQLLFTAAASTFEATSFGLLDISYARNYFQTHFWTILTVLVGAGIFIGAASSYIATRRYLKFKTSK